MAENLTQLHGDYRRLEVIGGRLTNKSANKGGEARKMYPGVQQSHSTDLAVRNDTRIIQKREVRVKGWKEPRTQISSENTKGAGDELDRACGGRVTRCIS
jgi:hypothetical protein